MKRILGAVLALCLIIAFLPGLAVPAEAADFAYMAQSLQFADAYDFDADEWMEKLTTAVVFKAGGQNYVITNLAPQGGNKGAMHSMNDEDYYLMEHVSAWNDLQLYAALPDYESEYGTYPVGTTRAGEKIYVIVFQKNERQYVEVKVTGVANGKIQVNEPLDAGLPLAILNAKYEVCGVIYNTTIWSLEAFTGNAQPPATEPPATEPPATNPPATEPPATEPPATEPPASQGTGLAVKMSTDLKDLENLYEEATIKQTSNKSGTISLVVIAVLVVALTVLVVLLKRKKQKKIKNMLHDVEEGTTLDDSTVLDDGTELSEKPVVNSNLRLQFRNGKRIAPTRSFTIGRAPDNDIVLPNNSSASGHHSEIVVQNGAVYLRDLGSTNGTYVNGRRIAAGQLIQLTPGMVVYLGGPNSSEAFQVTISGQ